MLNYMSNWANGVALAQLIGRISNYLARLANGV